MSNSRLKQIKRILQDDVRDPRATIKAIAEVVNQPKEPKDKGPTPILQLTLRRSGSNLFECVVKTDPKTREAGHVIVAIESLEQFGSEMYGCDDPDCPVHGTATIKPMPITSEELKDLFDKITKGNLQ